MWSKSYSKKITGLTVEHIWRVWTDVNRWHEWQDDIDYAKLDGHFAVNNVILFKPKGGPKIKLHLVNVDINKSFTDLTRFPLAKMYDDHEIIDHGDQVELKTTIRMKGPLTFLWRKIIAENIVKGLEKQTENLINQVREGL